MTLCGRSCPQLKQRTAFDTGAITSITHNPPIYATVTISATTPGRLPQNATRLPNGDAAMPMPQTPCDLTRLYVTIPPLSPCNNRRCRVNVTRSPGVARCPSARNNYRAKPNAPYAYSIRQYDAAPRTHIVSYKRPPSPLGSPRGCPKSPPVPHSLQENLSKVAAYQHVIGRTYVIVEVRCPLYFP